MSSGVYSRVIMKEDSSRSALLLGQPNAQLAHRSTSVDWDLVPSGYKRHTGNIWMAQEKTETTDRKKSADAVSADSSSRDLLLLEFGKATMNGMVQRPVNGLTELLDETFKINIPSMTAFDLPTPSSTDQAMVQQAGQAIGMIAPFMAARFGVKGMKYGLGLAESQALLATVTDHAATGFLVGFALTPSGGMGLEFWANRGKQGAIDAGTFAAMGTSADLLRTTFLPAALKAELPLSSRIVRSSLIGGASGVPGGLAHANLHSLFEGRGFASGEQMLGDAAGFALFGALMGPLDAIIPVGDKSKTRLSDHVDELYGKRTPEQEARGRAAVRADLREHRSYDVDLQSFSENRSVWDKVQEAQLEPGDMKRVLNSLAYVREGFAKQRNDSGFMDLEQKGNWLHTMDELDAALDITHGQTSAEVTRSVMAMFGDAWKNKSNFTQHNYDGARVAEVVLSRQTDPGFTNDHVRGIVESNKEHQVSPPGLMGLLYTNRIFGALQTRRSVELVELLEARGSRILEPTEAARLAEFEKFDQQYQSRAGEITRLNRNEQRSAEENARLNDLQARQKAGSLVDDASYDVIQQVSRKIADPYAHELTTTPEGGMALKLTDPEATLFRMSGADHWNVPHESTPWFKESRTGVMADILANLGLGGRRKFTGLNGPETDPFFQFGTIDQCVTSALRTYSDINKILSPAEFAYVQKRLGTMDGAIGNAMKRVGEWLKTDPTLADNPNLKNVPFWDSALKYPERGVHEQNWWVIHRTPEANRSPQQQHFWKEHRYDGLNPKELQDYRRAIRIRERTVEELGREQRLDNGLVPDFEPVMDRRSFDDLRDSYRTQVSSPSDEEKRKQAKR